MCDSIAALIARVGLCAIVFISFPVGAYAATTTCSSVSACIFGINSASGIGVEGTSITGLGVDGVSKSGFGIAGSSTTNDGVVGKTLTQSTSAGTGKAGVAGYDSSTNKTTYNSGVYGVSSYGMGVQGRSTYGPGLLALSVNGNGITASAGSPLYSGFTNVGLVAQSANGDGIIGVGPTTGIVGFAAECGIPNATLDCLAPLSKEIPSGAAVVAATDQVGLGLAIFTDENVYQSPTEANGVGATIESGSVGMEITPDRGSRGATGLIVNGSLSPREYSEGFQGAIIAGFNGLSVTSRSVGIAVTGDDAILAQSGTVVFQGANSSGTATSQLDGAGNLVIAGTLTEKGTITSQLHNADGTFSAAYTARSTEPTVEDMGEANMVAGSAAVLIDAALRKSVDVSRGYLVFLTPQGATSGLYVTGKTASGFTVREIGNAHDSLAFDYRIVAHPYAEAGPRLVGTTGSIRSITPNKALFYRHMRPLRMIHGKVDKASLPIPSL